MRAMHSLVQPQEHPIPPPWAADDIPDPPPEDFDAMLDEDHVLVEGECELHELEHHMLLCGAFCICFYLLNRHTHCSFHNDTMQ